MSRPQPNIDREPIFAPPTPLKVENTGLDFGFLADLALKTVYTDANCSTERAAEKLKLTMPVTEELLQHLYREKFVEIRGLVSYGNNRYGMLDRGWQRAQQLLQMNGYIGPAPVSLPAYSEMILRQSAAREPVEPEAVIRMRALVRDLQHDRIGGRVVPRVQDRLRAQRRGEHEQRRP